MSESSPPEVFGVIPEHQMESMALIHAIRTLTSAIERQATRQDRQEGKLDAIRDDIGEIKTRLSVIEHDSLGAQVASLRGEVSGLREDVDTLKLKEAERKGAGGIVLTLLKSPTLGWLVVAIGGAWAVLTGKVHV